MLLYLLSIKHVMAVTNEYTKQSITAGTEAILTLKTEKKIRTNILKVGFREGTNQNNATEITKRIKYVWGLINKST